MIKSRLFNFIRAHPAVLVAAILIIVFILGLVGALRPKRATSDFVLFTNSAPSTTVSVLRETGPLVSAAPKTAPPSTVKTKPFTGCHFHVNLPPDTNARPLGVYAPAGRLIRCQLVNTVDSANIDTPIIALVTDDLWHDGHIVIAAGTEVHGRAQVDRMRERIVASGAWTLVWQSGQELVVNGIALDRDESAAGGTWGITDGSAGLKGQVLRSDSLAEIKLFVATFMSGIASGFQETRTTLLGTQVATTARNAALAGTSQVMNTYAQQILETVKREGLFVRVPAGKQMYLYVTQTIDQSQGKVGTLRVSIQPTIPPLQNSSHLTKP